MKEICGDNRFEIIAKAKEHLLDATNIDTSEDEMKVLDSFLFRCWQMGWLDRYDCKTESNSEKSNNCETCRFELYCPEMCEGCCEYDSHYEPKDEPQTEADKYWLSLLQDVVDGKMSAASANQAWYEYINHKDEPQTDCPWG